MTQSYASLRVTRNCHSRAIAQCRAIGFRLGYATRYGAQTACAVSGRESDLMTGQTPLPAECRLIRSKREAKVPTMSVRAAARRAKLIPGASGWSEGSWRRYEGGG